MQSNDDNNAGIDTEINHTLEYVLSNLKTTVFHQVAAQLYSHEYRDPYVPLRNIIAKYINTLKKVKLLISNDITVENTSALEECTVVLNQLNSDKIFDNARQSYHPNITYHRVYKKLSELCDYLNDFVERSNLNYPQDHTKQNNHMSDKLPKLNIRGNTFKTYTKETNFVSALEHISVIPLKNVLQSVYKSTQPDYSKGSDYQAKNEVYKIACRSDKSSSNFVLKLAPGYALSKDNVLQENQEKTKGHIDRDNSEWPLEIEWLLNRILKNIFSKKKISIEVPECQLIANDEEKIVGMLLEDMGELHKISHIIENSGFADTSQATDDASTFQLDLENCSINQLYKILQEKKLLLAAIYLPVIFGCHDFAENFFLRYGSCKEIQLVALDLALAFRTGLNDEVGVDKPGSTKKSRRLDSYHQNMNFLSGNSVEGILNILCSISDESTTNQVEELNALISCLRDLKHDSSLNILPEKQDHFNIFNSKKINVPGFRAMQSKLKSAINDHLEFLEKEDQVSLKGLTTDMVSLKIQGILNTITRMGVSKRSIDNQLEKQVKNIFFLLKNINTESVKLARMSPTVSPLQGAPEASESDSSSDSDTPNKAAILNLSIFTDKPVNTSQHSNDLRKDSGTTEDHRLCEEYSTVLAESLIEFKDNCNLTESSLCDILQKRLIAKKQNSSSPKEFKELDIRDNQTSRFVSGKYTLISLSDKIQQLDPYAIADNLVKSILTNLNHVSQENSTPLSMT